MPFKQNVKARMNFGEVAAMSVMQQRAQQEQAVQYLTAIAVNAGVSKATNGISTTNNNTNTNQRQTTAENSTTTHLDNGKNKNSLRYNGDGTWTSDGGLVYGQGSKDGNRVNHVLQHTKPNENKPTHTVFNVNKTKVLGLVDEAWGQRGKGVLQANGNVKYG